MDSGLGSDEERRGRTKEQKQRHNQQLLSGCFIDAANLSDEAEVVTDLRRNDERRQGALLFQASIPQFSMLQMPVQQLSASCTSIPTSSYAVDNSTPYNSIVHLDQDNASQKPSLGFYVDLSDVGEPEPEPVPSSAKKNIFSMVIDFGAPKKDKPSRLSSSLRNGKKKNEASDSICKETLNCGGSNAEQEAENSQKPNKADEEAITNGTTSQLNSLSLFDEASGGSMLEQKQEIDLPDTFKKNDQNLEVADVEACSEVTVINSTAVREEATEEKKQFVRLSDLEHQTPRTDLILAPRMSRSIPESSWVESPLFMSNSIGYRSAPRPLEPENCDSSDGGSSLTDTSISQPRRSVARLGTDLLRMFLEEIGPDVVVEVGARKIRAHRCILVSRCQYFAASLSGRSREVISIKGFTYDAVHFAMCHIYSGAAHVPDSISLAELASLADMLCLEGLKEVVAHALKSRHCHNFHRPCAGCCIGVVEVLHLSAAYGLDELYQKCLRWITQHFVRIWLTKAFCGLTKELREKCYQQHVIHLSEENVLETILGCNRLLATVPSLRWVEPVVKMGLQLTEACQLYLRQHFFTILNSPTFLALDSEQAWNISRLEGAIIEASAALSIEQGTKSYSCCKTLLEGVWSPGFLDLLKKINNQLEQSLVARAERVAKSNAWLNLDPKLRARLKELSCLPLDEPATPRPTRTPISKNTLSPRTRLNQSRNTPSSTESSRNTSPSMKLGGIEGSPSLRRSLLLAARAPQVPPSPSVQRRSTLTKPTASSTAKSAPSRNLKAPVKTNSKPAAVTKGRETERKMTTSTRSTSSAKLVSRDLSKTNVPKNIVNSNRVSTPSSSRKVINPTTTKAKQVQGVPEKSKPATVQRSGTFLKEKPTVLVKTQAEAPLVQS